MDQLLNNPAMMSIANAMMNDPEMKELMENPEVASKLQGLMSGTTPVSDLMGDSDFAKIMAKMQQLQMGMGMGTGGGGFGNGNANGNANSSSDSSGIVHLSSPNQFQALMEKSKNTKQPLVIDYFATWCGPCKMIAPVFEELSSSYRNRAIFVKVDGDMNRALVSSQGVRGFPTFQIWQDGKKVEEWSGADERRLRAAVENYAAQDPAEAAANKHAYRHFPVKDNELASYAKIKWELVTPKLKENNSKLADSNDEKDHAHALTNDEMKDIEKVIDGLNDRFGYHSHVWNEKQFTAVAKLLQWPNALAGPALHFFRIFIMHPSAAKYYANATTDSKQDTKAAEDVISRVCQLAVGADNVALLTTSVWCASNLFSKISMHKALATRYEQILDTINSLLQRKECDAIVENEANILSVVGILINLSFVLSYQQHMLKRKDAASNSTNTIGSKVLEQAKVQLLSAVVEAAEKYNQHSKVLYRLFVILGTILLDDASLTELASDLELASIIEQAKKAHSKEGQLLDACGELSQLLDKQISKK